MLPHLGMPELLVVLVIIIIVFGVGRLPEVGGAMGKAIREFRQSSEVPSKEEEKSKEGEKEEKEKEAEKKE